MGSAPSQESPSTPLTHAKAADTLERSSTTFELHPRTVNDSGKSTHNDEEEINYYDEFLEHSSVNLFSSKFLQDVGQLSSNAMETAIYLKFALKQAWRNLLFPELRCQLLESTFRLALDAGKLSPLPEASQQTELKDTYPNQFTSNALKAILKHLTFQELQSVFIIGTLCVFFQYRNRLDFKVNSSQSQSCSRDELLDSVFVNLNNLNEEEFYEHNKVLSKRSSSIKKHFEEAGLEEHIIDPEDLFVLISIYSTVEEIEYLLVSGCFNNHYVSCLEKLGFIIAMWDMAGDDDDYKLPQKQEEIELQFPLVFLANCKYDSLVSKITEIGESEKKRNMESLALMKQEVEKLRNYFSFPAFVYRAASIQKMDLETLTSTSLSSISKPSIIPKTFSDFQSAIFQNQCFKACLNLTQQHDVSQNQDIISNIFTFTSSSTSSADKKNSTSLSSTLSNSTSVSLFSSNRPELLFFTALPLRFPAEKHYLLTIHCPINAPMMNDQLFLHISDFLFFSLAGLQKYE